VVNGPVRADRALKWITAATDTLRELMAVYLVITAAATIGFMATEGLSVRDAIWLSFVTATSTGYGDFFPKTNEGRVIAGLLMHVTLFAVIPLITARLSAQLTVNSDAFTHEEQEEIRRTLAEVAAHLKVSNEQGAKS
jgi:voltage-gated potassium channel